MISPCKQAETKVRRKAHALKTDFSPALYPSAWDLVCSAGEPGGTERPVDDITASETFCLTDMATRFTPITNVTRGENPPPHYITVKIQFKYTTVFKTHRDFFFFLIWSAVLVLVDSAYEYSSQEVRKGQKDGDILGNPAEFSCPLFCQSRRCLGGQSSFWTKESENFVNALCIA